MSLVLDTTILVEIERKDKRIIAELKKLSKIYPFPAQLSLISYFEFLYGIKVKKTKEYDRLLEFLNKFNVLQTTKNTAEILSDLRIKYEKRGISFSLADLLIASQVIENNLTLLTMDKGFDRIQELKKIII